jgi:hypothetical protein
VKRGRDGTRGSYKGGSQHCSSQDRILHQWNILLNYDLSSDRVEASC